MTIRLAITGAQLLDGVARPPFPSSTVLVNAEGRIAAAGPSQSVPIPAGHAHHPGGRQNDPPRPDRRPRPHHLGQGTLHRLLRQGLHHAPPAAGPRAPARPRRAFRAARAGCGRDDAARLRRRRLHGAGAARRDHRRAVYRAADPRLWPAHHDNGRPHLLRLGGGFRRRDPEGCPRPGGPRRGFHQAHRQRRHDHPWDEHRALAVHAGRGARRRRGCPPPRVAGGGPRHLHGQHPAHRRGRRGHHRALLLDRRRPQDHGHGRDRRGLDGEARRPRGSRHHSPPLPVPR